MGVFFKISFLKLILIQICEGLCLVKVKDSVHCNVISAVPLTAGKVGNEYGSAAESNRLLTEGGDAHIGSCIIGIDGGTNISLDGLNECADYKPVHSAVIVTCGVVLPDVVLELLDNLICITPELIGIKLIVADVVYAEISSVLKVSTLGAANGKASGIVTVESGVESENDGLTLLTLEYGCNNVTLLELNLTERAVCTEIAYCGLVQAL